MIRKILLLALFSPALAAATDLACGSAPTAALPASIPVPEMAAAALASPARDCSRLTALAFIERSRRPVPPPAPAQRPAPPAPGQVAQQPGGYVPKTKDDNTPWRFDMNQNGRRMTAEEFDAWMKAKGIRVATGRPNEAAPAEAAPAAAAPASSGD